MTGGRTSSREAILEAARDLACRVRLLVICGAGTSRDAGVPTFRDEGGLWQRWRAEDLASVDGFARDAEAVWDWYRERRFVVANCEPHPGQRSLALLESHFGDRLLLATTNEDDLLQRAGCQRVVHLHGKLFDTACSAGCRLARSR